MNLFRNSAFALVALSYACGSDAGTVEFTTYGEDFIEKEIPAAAGGGEGFVDGATVRFSKFLVATSRIQVDASDGDSGASLAEQRIFDVQRPGPHVIESVEVAGRRWDRVGIDIVPASGATAGNATDADVALMNDGGYSLYAAGTVTTTTASYTFAWGFSTATRYAECEDASGQLGVLVPTGGNISIQFTMHGDHLFYDGLRSDDPALRFSAMAAADANSDSEITLDELAAVNLSTLPANQYDTGGAANVTNLREFVTALTRTVVHFQGEGECKISMP